MRTVSLPLLKEMLAQQSEARPVMLLTVTHPDLAEPILLSSADLVRLSDAPLQYGTISRGKTYLFFPFAIVLPDDIGERAPVAQLRLENVSRNLVALIRSVSTPPRVTMELVRAQAPDVVEIAWPNFDMKAAPYNANVMTISLGVDAMTDTPYPARDFDPSSFPGLF